jgi:hypothetical protein
MGYSDVTIEGNTIHYDLFLLADLLGGVLLIDENQDGHMSDKEIKNARPDFEHFIFSQLAVANNESLGKPSMKSIEETERWNAEMFHLKLEFEFDEPVENYEMNYNLFFDGIDENHQNFLTVHHGDEGVEHVFARDNRFFETEINENGQTIHGESLGFSDYLIVGMKHIWAGIDYFLFLFIVGLILVRGRMKDFVKI